MDLSLDRVTLAANETTQHRNHRARRSRQDHPGGSPIAAVGRARSAGREHRPGDGLQRTGARAWHYDPVQDHRNQLERLSHQHRRHSRARGLRGRGGTGALDGRLGAVAGRCGRRSHAADSLRHREGALARTRSDRGHQQGRPRQRETRVRVGRDLRAVRSARGERRAARFSGGLLLGPRRLRQHRRTGCGRGHGAIARHHRRTHPGPGGRSDRTFPDAGQHARLLELRRGHRHRQDPTRPDTNQHPDRAGQRGR